jgi:hypothetical protein
VANVIEGDPVVSAPVTVTPVTVGDCDTVTIAPSRANLTSAPGNLQVVRKNGAAGTLPIR